MNDLEDIVNQSVHDLLELTKSAEQKEQDLAEKKERVAKQHRINGHTTRRLGFHKEEAMKRSISTTYILDDFGEFEDHQGLA